MTKKPRIASVAKALAILERFVQQPELSATSISQQLNLKFSTVHHLMSTLLGCGYLVQNPSTKRYRLGPKVLRLGFAAENSLQLMESARPVLQMLVDRVSESANIAILDGSEIVYVGHVQSTAPLRMFTRLGARAPLYCTGVGKVLLAAMAEERAKNLVLGSACERYTDHTLTNWCLLWPELQRVRQQGYAVDREEREIGVTCIAAPVKDARGETCAAVSISGPAGRISQRIDELAIEVIRASVELSRELGYASCGLGKA